MAGVELCPAPPLTMQLLGEVHAREYIRAVETGQSKARAESQGFPWDPGLWPMALASNGGAVAAALAALLRGVAGSLSSGLHHARRDRGAGFCTFNGLVLAARAALAGGAGAVLILDLDAHCGGGTHSLIANNPRIWQLDVAVSDFDVYAPSARTTLDLVQSASEYLPTIVRGLRDLERRAPRFDLCLYNAGMDPYEHCPIGGLPGITRVILADRERIVFEWGKARGIPVAFVLAGGYIGRRLDAAGLVELHRLTLSAAASAGTTNPSTYA